MILIIGLGNPGKEYEKTRHNAGFMTLDAFAKEHNFPEFSMSKKHSSLVSEGFLGQAKDTTPKVILAKPQTFMNNSGKAVKLLMPKPGLGRRPKPGLGLIVIHDDIDIPLGKIKVSQGSGSAGHKGVDSIIQSLGTKNFTRIRIGILPLTGKPENAEDFVLQTFRKTEFSLLQSAIQEATSSVLSLIG